MDSTRAIIKLWRYCSPASHDAPGNDGAISVDVVKEVLRGQLQDKTGPFGGTSVDSIIQRYMQPDSAGVIGFLQFWQGMEEILQALGSVRNFLSPAQDDALKGFKRIRQCVLDWGARQNAPNHQCFMKVEDLKYFIERAAGELGADGQGFWMYQATQLPAGSQDVTGEEVASALLAWLERLLDEDDCDASRAERSEQHSGRSRSSGSSAQEESFSGEEDMASPVRSSARTSAPRLPPRSPYDNDHSLLFSARTGTPGKGAAFAVGISALQTGEGAWMEQQQPPATPKGPPPRRSVQANSRASLDSQPTNALGGRASLESRHSSGGSARRRGGAAALEATLTAIISREDRRPASPTKKQAHEWREAIELQVALRRYLSDLRAKDLEFTLRGFYSFARENLSAIGSRRRQSALTASPGPSPRNRGGQNACAAKVLHSALHRLFQARLSRGFGAFVGVLRRNRRRARPAAKLGGGHNDLMRELLKAQCEAAVELEQRVKIAGRVGPLVMCLNGLERTQLRYSWMRWNQFMPQEEPMGRGPSPLPQQWAGGGQFAAARAKFGSSNDEGSRHGSVASRGSAASRGSPLSRNTPPPGRSGPGGPKMTE